MYNIMDAEFVEMGSEITGQEVSVNIRTMLYLIINPTRSLGD